MLQMQSSEVQQALQLQMQAAAAGWSAGSPYLPPGTMWPFHMYSTPAWAAAQAAALAQYDHTPNVLHHSALLCTGHHPC